jgi:hypothetical protein
MLTPNTLQLIDGDAHMPRTTSQLYIGKTPEQTIFVKIQTYQNNTRYSGLDLN